MYRAARVVVTCTAVAGASAGLMILTRASSAQSEPPQAAPPPAVSSAAPALSPDEEQQFRSGAQRVLAMQQLLGLPPAQQAHAVAEQALSGDGLAEPTRSAVVEFAAPYRQQFLDFLDEQMQRMQQQLKAPGPAAAVDGVGTLLRPARWDSGNWPDAQAFAGASSQPGVVRPYRLLALGGGQSGASSGGSTSGSVSKDLGNGVTATLTVNETDGWKDNQTSIAAGGGTTEITNSLTPQSPVPPAGLTSLTLSAKTEDGARVDRCPSADGRVPGTYESSATVTFTVGTETGIAARAASWIRENATAEAHVTEDALIHEVVVHVDASSQESGAVYRWWGDAIFDPHSQAGPPLQNMGCARGQLNVPSFLCGMLLDTGRNFFPALTNAYLRAESDWNSSHDCVAPSFTPPTDTTPMDPSQTIQVKTDLIAIKDKQPTWGILQILAPVPWPHNVGRIESNGTRASADASGVLTFTAPPQPWPCDRIPGFYIEKATSRAGAITLSNGVHKVWQPTSCRYALEVTYDANVTMTMGAGVSDQVTEGMRGSAPGGRVEIPLNFHPDGTVTGEGRATVARNSMLVMGVGRCAADPSTAQIMLRLTASGTVTGKDTSDSVLHLVLGNAGPVSVTGVSCEGAFAHSGVPEGTQMIALDLPNQVGAERTLVISPPALPRVATTGSWTIKVKLVDLSQR